MEGGGSMTVTPWAMAAPLLSATTEGIPSMPKVERSNFLMTAILNYESWLSGLKGVKPPLVFGGRTRDCSPGNV